MILTGRPVGADEALRVGLCDRVVEDGTAREEAEKLAREIAAFPQLCMNADRASAYSQWDTTFDDAMRAETEGGLKVIASGETVTGAMRFAGGAGRHGTFE
jgi:enoyl-CoA hydratase